MIKDELSKMQLKVQEKVDKCDRSIVLVQREILQVKMDQQTPIAQPKIVEFDSSKLCSDIARVEAFCHNLAVSIKNIENRKEPQLKQASVRQKDIQNCLSCGEPEVSVVPSYKRSEVGLHYKNEYTEQVQRKRPATSQQRGGVRKYASKTILPRVETLECTPMPRLIY